MPHPDIKTPETSFMDKCNILIHIQHISSGETVRFYGILDAYNDSYNSKWNPQTVYGRNDPIATFQGTSRTITIGWKVLSEDDNVGLKNMKDISKLVNFLYPTYDSAGNRAASIAAAPLLRLKFNNLITNASSKKIGIGLTAEDDGLVGFVNGSVTVNTNINAGFLTPHPGTLVPREISLQLAFTVVHTHALGWTVDKRTRTNGLFPYKTGGAWTPNVSSNSGHEGATNENDKIPDEVTDSTKRSLVSRVGNAAGALADAVSFDFGGQTEEEQSSSTTEANRKRAEAGSDTRTSTAGLTEAPSDTSGPELDEHFDDIIKPDEITFTEDEVEVFG